MPWRLCSRYLQQNPCKNPLPGQFVRPSSRFNPFAMYNMRIANAGGRFAISKQLANAGEFQSAPGGNSPMKNVFRACLAAAIAYAILSTAAPQRTTSSKTFRESAFTAEQAARGEQVYTAKCSTCHGDNLQGWRWRRLWQARTSERLGNPTAADARQSNQDHHAADCSQLAAAAQITDLLSYILKANEITRRQHCLEPSHPDSAAATMLLPSRQR